MIRLKTNFKLLLSLAVIAALLALMSADKVFATEESLILTLVLSRPDVVASKLNIKKQEKLLEAELGKRLPQVDVQSSSQRVVSEEGALPSRATANGDEFSDASIITTYAIFDSGINRFNAEIQRSEIELAKYDYFLSINSRFRDVVPALLERVEAERKISAVEKILEVIRQFDSIAERRFNSGVASIQEVRRIKLALVNTELALQDANIQLKKADSKLIENYGFDLEFLSSAVEDLDNLLARAESMVTSNQFEQAISVLRINKEIEQLKQMTNLRIAQNSIQVGTDFEAKRYGLGRDNSSSDVVGRLTISFPLFDGGTTKYTESAYEFDIQSKENLKQSLISDSRDVVKSLSLELQDESVRLELLIEKSKNVEAQIREKLSRYGQVEVDVAGLVDLTSDSLNTQVDLIRSEFRTRLLRQEILAKMEIWPLLLQP